MKTHANWIAAAGLAACLCVSTLALGQTAAAPVTAPKGAAVLSSAQVTATVTKIDHKSRKVTLKAADGHEESFVADPAVKNLDQVKKGDVVTLTYTEALAYEVRKSGKPGADTVVAAAAAKPGEMPAGAIGQNTLITVVITAIDPKAPSVTVKGPQGNSQTFKVASADKLKGVKVGDAVDLSYTEAVAIKVEKASKQ